jgi:hypothetical protein
MSPCSRLKAEIGVPDDEPIQADVTLNSICIEQVGDMIVMRFSSLLQCEVQLSLSEADAKDFIQQLSCSTQTP